MSKRFEGGKEKARSDGNAPQPHARLRLVADAESEMKPIVSAADDVRELLKSFARPRKTHCKPSDDNLPPAA